MKKQTGIQLDFIVDKLTNSIQNTISGDSFPTEIARFMLKDTKQTTNKNGWNFNWKGEIKKEATKVYKLVILGNESIIQGLISLED